VKFLLSLDRDDGLDQQDQGIDSVTEAVEAEQFPVMRGESNLIDGLDGDSRLHESV
jgi:hypothetical protein